MAAFARPISWAAFSWLPKITCCQASDSPGGSPDFLEVELAGISLYHLEEYEEAVEVLELTQLLDPSI